jgi:lipopolysaccharide/colanic/teichoic acid biosynthesis glycosyltransferase
MSRWTLSPGKRCVDVVVSTCLLVLCAPLIAVAAAAVKLTSRGPVVFRQVRIGRCGIPFEIIKLRTMSECGRQGRAAGGVTRASDQRIVPVGRWLRRFKLDELPQFWNVLRGDMSLVGPRPLVPEQDPPLFICRPGLTSPGSLAFRLQELALSGIPADLVPDIHAAALVPTRFAMDRRYLQTASFFSDLAIIAETALIVARLRARSRYDIDVPGLVAAYLTRRSERRAVGAGW